MKYRGGKRDRKRKTDTKDEKIDKRKNQSVTEMCLRWLQMERINRGKTKPETDQL